MALPPLNDTIAAIATAPGSGAIGVVRVSGVDTYRVADAVFRGARGARPSDVPAGRVVYGAVSHGTVLIDEAVLLTFRSPHSYTGQDVVEVQSHGGPAVLRRVLDACLAAGARSAGPGEFTLRAYLNGRIDLAQAEAVLDLVNASTDAARRNATLGLSGALSQRLGAIQTDLTSAYAAVQAAFDYPEEGVEAARLSEPLARAGTVVDELLATVEAGRLSRHGARLAVLGRPNAGKSSLLNALLGYQRSLVSATPGTTRDYLEAPMVIGGIPVTVIDTAGIRSASDHVEAGGVELSRSIARGADMRLLLIDGSAPLGSEEKALLREVAAVGEASGRGAGATVYVASKADLEPAWTDAELRAVVGDAEVVRVSAVTTTGLDELQRALADRLVGDAAGAELWISNERHAQALATVRDRLRAAVDAPHDVASLELLDALTALAGVTGRDGVAEETLASIFANFCVGK